MNDCIFCQIVEKKIPSPIIYEDDFCVVIPDKFPATDGQTLVVIKKHIPYFLDLPEDLYLHILKVSRKVSASLQKTFKPERVCLVIEGFHVPHVHIKLYPVVEKHLILTGTGPKEDEHLKQTAERIKINLK